MAHKTQKEELLDALKDMHHQVEEVRQEMTESIFTQMRRLSVLESYIFVMTREVSKLPDES